MRHYNYFKQDDVEEDNIHTIINSLVSNFTFVPEVLFHHFVLLLMRTSNVSDDIKSACGIPYVPYGEESESLTSSRLKGERGDRDLLFAFRTLYPPLLSGIFENRKTNHGRVFMFLQFRSMVLHLTLQIR